MILGASFDSVADNRAFAEKHQYPFALLSDADRSIALAYGAAESAQDQYPRRHTYVISADGKLEQVIATKDPAAQAADLLPGL